jgi:oligopeptide/dipeptide ABC transporter ATP-binding protein
LTPVSERHSEAARPGGPAGNGGDVLLDVRDLTVDFRIHGETVHAVRGISYAVRRGEALGLVGESGSGKSVSALALLGLLPSPPAVVTGSAVFEGRDLLSLAGPALRRVRGGQVGIVFQDPLSSLNPVLTIGRQIREALELHRGLRGRAAEDRAVELLDLVGIPDPRGRLSQYPHEFSGGMRQRAMIAAALAPEPSLLIADEPTTALDVTVQAQLLELFGRLREELGMTIVMITHDLGVVAGLVDRVNVMYAGRIVESSDAEALLERPRHPYTLGLIRSVPRIDRAREANLVPIGGAPPDPRGEPAGCPFRPRCAFAFDRCGERPPLLEVPGGRRSACWLGPEGLPSRRGDDG